MIGEHVLTIAGVDVSCLVDRASITHGRGDTSGQPEASAITVDITVGPGTPLPAAVDIGAPLTVDTHLGAVVSRRFTGTITDVSLGWKDAGEDTPDTGIGQIVAVGPLADYGRRVIGDVPFPQELDGARVARVFNAAGLVLDPAFSDPGTVQVIPRDVDARAALEVATDTAVSAGGLIWETRAGDIRYADAVHRRGAAVALELDACDILVTPTWARNTGGLVNDLSIAYGVTPAGGGERPTYRASNPASSGRYGRYEYSATVELADLVDVTAAANLILVQNGRPVWLLQALPIDVAGLDETETATLLALDMHGLLRVTGLPTTGQTPVNVVAWVEGWTETLAWGVHDLELWVSDYCRTSPPPRWNDVPPETTWDTVPPATTWDSAACMGPPTDFGRWDDVSATTRWDQVPADVEWDEAGVLL